MPEEDTIDPLEEELAEAQEAIARALDVLSDQAELAWRSRVIRAAVILQSYVLPQGEETPSTPPTQ